MPQLNKKKLRTIVFTDLDGTLIDFETYSFTTTAPLAQKLINKNIPLVFCSSKTLEEQLHLMKEMGILTPCIVENGSGIFVPGKLNLLNEYPSKPIGGFGKLVKLGVSNLKIQKTIASLTNEMGIDFLPYSKLTLLKITKITGLSEEAAQRAQNREFSETLTATLSDATWKEVNTQLNKVGLQCLCGGRFYTVTSKDCGKDIAMKLLTDAYQTNEGGKWHSIAIGDSANDYAMLRSSDYPYLVQRPDGTWNEMEIPNLNRVNAIGPHGWVKAINDGIPQL